MRASLAGIVWLSAVLGSGVGARGDIAYHFKPGVEGQVRGFVQFAEIAPEVGDPDFTVRVSGSLVGAAPSTDPTSGWAFLDKWGLGVFNRSLAKDVGVQGQVQLDGRHGGEYIRLEFSVPVRITLLTFASVSTGESVELLADGAPIALDSMFSGSKSIREISVAQGVWPGTIDFTHASASTGFARQWDVLFPGSAFGDGIQLENVRVKPLPEPSTLLLASIGVAALWIGSRRRRARQT